MYGITPLDICLGINTHRASDEKQFFRTAASVEVVKTSENTAMAEVIFSNLKHYGNMHSSSLINEAIIGAIKIGLPSVGEYLESRLISLPHTFTSSTQKAIRADRLRETPGMGQYGMIRTEIMAPENEMKDDLFDKDGAL